MKPVDLAPLVIHHPPRVGHHIWFSVTGALSGSPVHFELPEDWSVVSP